MTLENILEVVSEYAQYDLTSTQEPLCLEAYVNGRPVRIQIGLPKQNQYDLVNQALEPMIANDRILIEAGFPPDQNLIWTRK